MTTLQFHLALICNIDLPVSNSDRESDILKHIVVFSVVPDMPGYKQVKTVCSPVIHFAHHS